MPTLEILAPFDGWCTPLDEVPDPVFAGRMLGDGLAVDPTSGVVRAPCAGIIITLPATAHAVSIRTPSGVDVLVHVGIDTVGLGGRGFEARVRPGDVVHSGEELIRFDLDIVARNAKSLLTPVLVTTEGTVLQRRHTAGRVKTGDFLFDALLRPEKPETQTDAPAATQQRTFVVPLHQGLHARPAALLSQSVKSLTGDVAIAAHGKTANARSVVAIMALGVRHGDAIVVSAAGTEASRAIEAIAGALDMARRMESASGHAGPESRIAAPRAAPDIEGAASTAAASAAGGTAGLLRGIAAVPGFAVGRATRLTQRVIAVDEAGTGVERERDALERARAEVRARLTRVADVGTATRREIVAAHLEFLDDPLINEAAQALVCAGKSAGFAWRTATRVQVATLAALDDTRLRERADDLIDVESHVLLALIGEARPMNLAIPDRAVILADDLLPSELTALDRQRLAAICLSRGGATSHVAILAAAMDVPLLVGLGDGLRDVADGAWVVVDADAGTLHTTPAAAQFDAALSRVQSRRAQRAAARAAAQTDCRTLDGTRIEIFANLGSAAEAAAAVLEGAEGCGLLRTEFLFIDRERAPDETEQLAAYQAIAAELGTRPLILRLMDVGGDKPLKYLPLPHEDNPALGLRGVRTALARPDLLRTQLRAALRVAPAGVVQLLIPMVTDAAEIAAVRAVIRELEAELGRTPAIRVGAMIETPAAALTASLLVREIDFLSIGTNDLTQYTLAMDRGHAELARRTDALHPAILQLIALAAAAGAEAGKTVAVCGGVAADRSAVPILIGLGIRELSVVPGAIPEIKRQVRGLRVPQCRDLAQRCLQLASAAEVRALVEQTFAGDTP
jgi:multiphosphoryl transfer protein